MRNKKSLEIRKPVQMVLFDRSKLSLLQLKLMSIILWHFYQQDTDAEMYEIEVDVIRRLLRYKGGLNKFVFEHLHTIAKQEIRWGYNTKDGEYSGFAFFLGEVKHEQGKVKYWMPPSTKKMILNREVYDIVSLQMLSLFRSKYASNLYELCHKYKGTTRGTTGVLTLSALRELLGIPSDEYWQRDFNRIRKNIIEPALAEVNEISDITVTPRYVHSEGRGRRVIGVGFNVKEKPLAVMPHKMPDLRKGPAPQGVKRQDIEKTEVDNIKANKIIDVINELDIPTQELRISEIYDRVIKPNPFLVAKWNESGITSALVMSQMDLFEEILKEELD